MLSGLADHMRDEVPDFRNWMSEREEQNHELMMELMSDPVLMDRMLDFNPGMLFSVIVDKWFKLRVAI